MDRFTVPAFTDSTGEVRTRPQRSDFTSDVEWLRADSAFNDKVASAANRAFDRRFRRVMRPDKPQIR